MAAKEYEGAKKAVESAKAGLALLNGTGEKGKKSQKKNVKILRFGHCGYLGVPTMAKA
jgi:hypothetical protein